MASTNESYNAGVEHRVVGGEEQHAIWVPLTTAEAEAVLQKAKAENVNIRYFVANMLRDWAKSNELSEDDLEKVAGGAGLQLNNLNFSALKIRSQVTPNYDNIGNIGKVGDTTMCAW